MRRIRRASTVLVLCVALLVPVAATASAASVVTTQMPQWPSISCATSGPVNEYPSDGHTTRRDCWWGYEILLSKNDSKLVVQGVGSAAVGAVSARTGMFVLIGASGLFGYAGERASQAIDGGRCLKVTVIYPGVPTLWRYYCT